MSGAGTQPPSSSKINPGTPFLHEGTVAFSSSHHPKMESILNKSGDVTAALIDALDKKPEAMEIIENRMPKLMGNSQEVLFTMLNQTEGNNLALVLMDPALTPKTKRLWNKVLREHAPEEFKAVEKVQKEYATMMKELRAAQLKALEKMDVPKGVDAAEWKKGIVEFKKSTREEAKNLGSLTESWVQRHFGIVREEGIGAALEHNFSWSSMKEHPGRTAIKVSGVAMGAALAYDAVFHESRKDADGNERPRSWAARTAEGLGGTTLAVGSALHGGR